MASAPSVSNFPWPYGWSSSGSFAATRTTIRASTLLSASTHESTAPPEHREGAGREPHRELDSDDRQVGGEETDKDSADQGGRRHGQDCKVVRDSGLVNGPEEGTLQVAGLRYVHQLRVVPAGPGDGEKLEATARIPRGGGHHVEEDGAAHMVGAGAGEQHAARGDEAHGAKVDLLIAGDRPGHALFRLGERRGIEHDRVEQLFAPLQVTQQIERVGLTPRDVRDLVEGGILRS